MKIKSWGSEKVIYEDETIEKALENGVKNGTDFNGAELSNLTLKDLNLKGGKFKNAFFEFSILENCNLENADLENAYMCQCSLKNTNLTNSIMTKANLAGTFFPGTILEVKKPPVDDAYFISEILWRKAETENQKYLASRIRMEWDINNRWEIYIDWAYNLLVCTWMKDILGKWQEFRLNLQEGKNKEHLKDIEEAEIILSKLKKKFKEILING